MKTRVFGGFLVVISILCFLWLGGIWFELFWLLVLAQAFREGEGFFVDRSADSVFLTPYRFCVVFLLCLVLFFILIPFLPVSGTAAIALGNLRIFGALLSGVFGLWLFLMARVLLNRGRAIEPDFIKTLSSFVVFAYVSCFYLPIFQISVLNGRQAPGIILFLFLVMWLQDTLAYFGGMLFGRHKMSLILSPKKTWEGAFSGFVGAFLLLYPFCGLLQELSGQNFILLFTLVAVGGQLGDLVESFLKRGFNIKDSGSIIPGHGGVLDRFDSVTAAAFIVVCLQVCSGIMVR